MKNTFLVKLHKEKKLMWVEPNEVLKDSYLKKSESNLLSAKILLNNGKLEEAVSLAYYSMYHLLTALLFLVGIKCENHTAGIVLLKEVFDLNNQDLYLAKRERIDKQYYADFSVTNMDVKNIILIAEKFNSQLINFMDSLTFKSAQEYREKFKNFIS